VANRFALLPQVLKKEAPHNSNCSSPLALSDIINCTYEALDEADAQDKLLIGKKII
jgi:hypothetical protein